MDQVKIKNFATTMEAELSKNMLEAYGIKSVVQSTEVHSSGISNDRFGADLFVLAKDFDKAKDLLGLTNL